jgi:predicted  nucleic acid-binding Zn-ribbon protein
MSVADAARVADVSERTIQRRINKGEYPTKTVDGKRVVRLSDTSDTKVSNLSQDVSQSEVIERLEADKERLQERVNELSQSVAELQDDSRGLKEQLQRKDQQIENLQTQLSDASQRHDTVVMQMSRMLEYERQPFWRKWRNRKALPAPGDVMDMETETEEKSET